MRSYDCSLIVCPHCSYTHDPREAGTLPAVMTCVDCRERFRAYTETVMEYVSETFDEQ